MDATDKPQLRCAKCKRPMEFVRVLPPLDDEPRLSAFCCGDCNLARTVPIRLKLHYELFPSAFCDIDNDRFY